MLLLTFEFASLLVAEENLLVPEKPEKVSKTTIQNMR